MALDAGTEFTSTLRFERALDEVEAKLKPRQGSWWNRLVSWWRDVKETWCLTGKGQAAYCLSRAVNDFVHAGHHFLSHETFTRYERLVDTFRDSRAWSHYTIVRFVYSPFCAWKIIEVADKRFHEQVQDQSLAQEASPADSRQESDRQKTPEAFEPEIVVELEAEKEADRASVEKILEISQREELPSPTRDPLLPETLEEEEPFFSEPKKTLLLHENDVSPALSDKTPEPVEEEELQAASESEAHRVEEEKQRVAYQTTTARFNGLLNEKATEVTFKEDEEGLENLNKQMQKLLSQGASEFIQSSAAFDRVVKEYEAKVASLRQRGNQWADSLLVLARNLSQNPSVRRQLSGWLISPDRDALDAACQRMRAQNEKLGSADSRGLAFYEMKRDAREVWRLVDKAMREMPPPEEGLRCEMEKFRVQTEIVAVPGEDRDRWMEDKISRFKALSQNEFMVMSLGRGLLATLMSNWPSRGDLRSIDNGTLVDAIDRMKKNYQRREEVGEKAAIPDKGAFKKEASMALDLLDKGVRQLCEQKDYFGLKRLEELVNLAYQVAQLRQDVEQDGTTPSRVEDWPPSDLEGQMVITLNRFQLLSEAAAIRSVIGEAVDSLERVLKSMVDNVEEHIFDEAHKERYLEEARAVLAILEKAVKQLKENKSPQAPVLDLALQSLSRQIEDFGRIGLRQWEKKTLKLAEDASSNPVVRASLEGGFFVSDLELIEESVRRMQQKGQNLELYEFKKSAREVLRLLDKGLSKPRPQPQEAKALEEGNQALRQAKELRAQLRMEEYKPPEEIFDEWREDSWRRFKELSENGDMQLSLGRGLFRGLFGADKGSADNFALRGAIETLKKNLEKRTKPGQTLPTEEEEALREKAELEACQLLKKGMRQLFESRPSHSDEWERLGELSFKILELEANLRLKQHQYKKAEQSSSVHWRLSLMMERHAEEIESILGSGGHQALLVEVGAMEAKALDKFVYAGQAATALQALDQVRAAMTQTNPVKDVELNAEMAALRKTLSSICNGS